MKRQSSTTRKRLADELKRREDVKTRYATLALAKLSPCSEEDKASVMKKIQNAATHSTGSSFVNEIKAFEAESLDPTAFRECLKTNFTINLTPSELDAAVKM